MLFCQSPGYLPAGLTITTPSIGLFGSGTISADILATNLLYKARTTLLANDRQEKIKSTYKSPLSIVAGVNWSKRRSAFCLGPNEASMGIFYSYTSHYCYYNKRRKSKLSLLIMVCIMHQVMAAIQ